MRDFERIESDINRAMLAEQHRLRRQLETIRHEKKGPALRRLIDDLARSVAVRDARQAGLPAVDFDGSLPIHLRREEIAEAIRGNQVVVVSGETGSGKSTQLPKICLALGRGVAGMIGHTQPRRIAARSISARIAEELRTSIGRQIGFKIRFTDVTGPETYVKLMTDGILLAETQGDRRLTQYDTIILDEAHERSLNIDFLLGYVKRLLPQRPELKLIITSATIDAARFAKHFAVDGKPAPVIEVTGRTYPVEIRYRPLEPDEDGREPDLEDSVVAAVKELARIDSGDVLIFLPTERDIHEMVQTLRGVTIPGDGPAHETEILPLYARLPVAQQQRIFQPHPHRRIVIATNVAESSLTVPGIRYVIDPGTARISRYSARSKTQRLPIEPISQASADQRAGRCGRLGPGVCIRLFSQQDYQTRDRYTTPEILRSNLASVILQTMALKLGEPEDFPFLDPPKPATLSDGYKTLFELGAIVEAASCRFPEQKRQDAASTKYELTELGRKLSRLPVDPRIGRMILAAADENCLAEVLIIAAALEVRDPRERPPETAALADAAHAAILKGEAASRRFQAEKRQDAVSTLNSDFLDYLKLWDFYHNLRRKLSRNQLRKACRQNFLSFNRMKEWVDVHLQLRELTAESGLQGARSPLPTNLRSVPGEGRGEGEERNSHKRNVIDHRTTLTLTLSQGERGQNKSDAVHRAILAGLLANVARLGENYEYTAAGGGKGYVWPGSALFHHPPKWIVAAEIVETTRRYLRTAARIDPRWIEPLAPHLVKRSYSEPYWDPERGAAMIFERVSLFGLVIVPRRPTAYGPIDPAHARQLMIWHGLVEGQVKIQADYLEHNRRLFERLDRLQIKMRRHDLLRDEQARFMFYHQRIPADAYDLARLNRWLKDTGGEEARQLFMTEADLLATALDPAVGERFPDAVELDGASLPVAYCFEPGAEDDGLTVAVPVEALGRAEPPRLGWLVPGLVEAKVAALIKSLPKPLRTALVPVPETARAVARTIGFGSGDFRELVAAELGRLAGRPIRPEDFQMEKIPAELQMHLRVVSADGQTLAQGRDWQRLREDLQTETVARFERIDAPRWNREGITAWDFGELPEQVTVKSGGLTLAAYPALIDGGDSVALQLADSPERAARLSRGGLRRLCFLAAQRELKAQVQWLPGLETMLLHAAPLKHVDLRRQLAELLADRAFLGDGPDFSEGKRGLSPSAPEKALPRTKTEFETLLRRGGERLAGAVQEIAGLAPRLFESFHQAQLALEQAASPLWQYAVDDMRGQMAELTGADFLTVTPWEWLDHYPRYFRAMVSRWDRLRGGGFGRDRQLFEQELQPRWERYRQRAESHAQRGIADPELERYRWHLEEFRVSLFAQQLGTAIPISAKRLDRQWALVGE
ncbi:MAG: ATP-dependent RNA helicase HrpA [Pirellulales bacterium]|nr:ATP-dependent RNA helicase HrpA [Pirellulales bacterium]